MANVILVKQRFFYCGKSLKSFKEMIDVRGLTNQYPEWAGLYKMADSLNEQTLRKQSLAAQQSNKRGAAGAFLQSYLDPKDYMSGTAYDPMILQGLQEAMQQGSKLAMAGADAPTLMMTLGPMVNRLTTYSTNAKNINKQVDDAINNMKADKQEGYDWAALKRESLQNAFFKTDESGKPVLDPTKADPSIDWVQKAIQDSPEKVTTPEAFDLYAKNAQVNKTLKDIVTMDPMGRKVQTKAHLIAQNYLTPEYNDDKTIKDFVPYHDLATEKGSPLYHVFDDGKGGKTKAQVRLLDEKIFDSLRPGQINYIRGLVKQHLKEYQDATGQVITENSPQAKLVARALAYDELNKPTRKAKNIEFVHKDQYSPQEVTLNVHSTDKYQETERKTAESRKLGRLDAGGETPNALQAIGRVFNGDPEYSVGQLIDKHSKKVIDITDKIPGGGLKHGRGQDFEYGGIYFDPKARALIVEKEVKDKFSMKSTTAETIPENQIGQFLQKIAESNGISYPQVRRLLDEMGYKGGKFTKAVDNSAAMEFENRAQQQSWKNAYTLPTTIGAK